MATHRAVRSPVAVTVHGGRVAVHRSGWGKTIIKPRLLKWVRKIHISLGGRVPVQLGRRVETPAETLSMRALPENPGRSKPAGAATSGVSDGRRNLGVVITGGSKGLGLAMAREFLRSGDSVVICGRDRQRLESAVAFLQQEAGADRANGMVCDVSDVAAMSAFADFAREQLPCVDIWINNAGQVTRKQALPSLPGDEVARVIRVNLMGSLLGSQEAIRVMQQQPHSGEPKYHIFNLGFSEWGASLSKSAVTHKASKTAVGSLRNFLAEELTDYGLTSIGVHNLSPGMVLTDLLLLDSTPTSRRFFNALAEEPESIAAVLVPQMRAVSGTGTRINYLTPGDAFGRIVSKLPQILGWVPARFFDSRGDRVQQKGEQYQENGVRIQLPTADTPVATPPRK